MKRKCLSCGELFESDSENEEDFNKYCDTCQNSFYEELPGDCVWCDRN